MPIIQLDVQPLTGDQRAELRRRAAAAVHHSIGSPYAYINIAIRESDSSNLVEAGGWGRYDDRHYLAPADENPGTDKAGTDKDRSNY
jgi:phenylpyruvate tautomerase PptA (4-oxalocrotonate tautomerase family)